MKRTTPLLKIDATRQEVFVNGRRIHLSPKEYRLLLALQKANRTLSREQLLEHICAGDESFDKDMRTVDQHVSHIRRKIKAPIIETVTTFGYKFIGG